MAELGLPLGVKKEPAQGKGFGECGALRMLLAGLEKGGGRLTRGWEPWRGGDLGQEP